MQALRNESPKCVSPLQDVIQKLHMKEPLLRPLMNDMEIKATGMLKSCGATGPPGTVKSQKPLTEFQPFNLTAVKPRPQKREKGTTHNTQRAGLEILFVLQQFLQVAQDSAA